MGNSFGAVSAFVQNPIPFSGRQARRLPAIKTTELFVSDQGGKQKTESSSSQSNNKKRRKKKKGHKTTTTNNNNNKRSTNNNNDSGGGDQVWRVYGISIHPDQLPSLKEDASDETSKIHSLLQRAIAQKLPSSSRHNNNDDDADPSSSFQFQVVRRSLDARKKLPNPVFSYIVDLTLPAGTTRGWKSQPGRLERLLLETAKTTTTAETVEKSTADDDDNVAEKKRKRVIIVGAGPAGLFCALQLLQQHRKSTTTTTASSSTNSSSDIEIVLLDRGQPVEQRGRDIGALIHRRALNTESNFAFGEGGAGTWSDGKLTTRIGRNSDLVRNVLETLVEFGAPSTILWEGSPHLGTDNLVRLLRNMRHHMIDETDGRGEILFGTKMTSLICDPDTGVVQGVVAAQPDGTLTEIRGDAVVLATGHSARDVYECLHDNGSDKKNSVQLEAKGFAVGFRIEHPQTLINDIQYGKEWGPSVQTGRAKTDSLNMEYFGETVSTKQHAGSLPVPSYRLATDKAEDGVDEKSTRGVYSFCMCPGGQIVPSSTDPNEMCVNGMSFSRRDSVWANSALVVTVSPDDVILEDYRSKYGVMAGLEFQKDMERRASVLGGGNWTVPVQRVTDFVSGTVSETIPSSSYRLGVKSAPCHEIYPAPITNALRDALTNYFEKKMPGYYHPDALLHAVETRTSSPLRISRDRETLEATGTQNLFPAGEGAGFAGGIVSAAVDGTTVAEAVLDKLYGTSRPARLEKSKSVGFSY
jgi:uncharacterized FAD-dependent dehydrogenase